MGGQLGVGKPAVVALGPTAQQNPVDPLEVEELRDRFPDQPVVERRSSQVEREVYVSQCALKPGLNLDEPVLRLVRKIVIGKPAHGVEFKHYVGMASHERLGFGVRVTVIVHNPVVEIIEPTACRQVLRPIISDPFINDPAAGKHLTDTVWTASDWKLN